MNSQEKNKESLQPLIPAGLASLAGNRDAITTAEFAEAISGSQQTLRKNYCLTGSAYGIRPIKVGNRLLWPVEKIARLILGG